MRALLVIFGKFFLDIVQYRLRSPHSPLLAVPFPRWGTLDGSFKLLRYSANIVCYYNFVWAVRNILLKKFAKNPLRVQIDFNKNIPI